MAKRLSRFLIDKVDERLGDVEKEKKFDIIMLIAGIIMALLGIIVVYINANDGSKTTIFVGLLLTMIGFVLAYVMTKEFIADCKKAQSTKTDIH